MPPRYARARRWSPRAAVRGLAALSVLAARGGAVDAAGEPWARRCTIRRLFANESLPAQLPRTAEPYILALPPGHNADMAERLGREALLAEMGDVTCTPSQAGSVRKGIEYMPLREYIETWMGRPVSRNAEENRYVFGEFGEQWAPLRDAYVRPPCDACAGHQAAVTIGLGGLHSGAPWHFHDAAFVEVLHGAKHFALLPPKHAAVREISEQIQGVSMFHWHLHARPSLDATGQLAGLQECVLRPGELLYSPDGWHHGVVNLEPHTAFVSTFLERAQDKAGASLPDIFPALPVPAS